MAAAALPAAFAASDDGPKAAGYLVGGDVESINPTAAMLANNDFFLGGYGFGSGRPGNAVNVPGASDALGNRFATGILGDHSYNQFPSADGTAESDGVHSRAFAVSGGKHTIVLGMIETQGYFDAYKQGPFGINEIRKDASQQIGDLAASIKAGDPQPGHGNDHIAPPVPSASEIVVDSDHSHGGPDTAGVWGGVPTSYLKLVHDRTVTAIVEAWQRMRPASLVYGTTKAGVQGVDPDSMDPLTTNQFRGDPNNSSTDDELRVLQARDLTTGDTIVTYVNLSAHATVLGSDNLYVTSDYTGALSSLMART